MKPQYLILPALILIALFAIPSPVHAGTMDVSAFPVMGGDCSTLVYMQHSFVIQATTVDVTGPNRDVFALVLYDGHGDAFAYIGISATVPGTWTQTNWGWNYPILIQPKSRPFTLKIFDNTTVVSTSFGDLAGAQHGTVTDVLHYDPADYGICASLPVYAPTSGVQAPFTDGRLNNWDMANPIVPYGHEFETGRGLVVYSPQGALLLVVTPEEIAAVEDCPEENTLIASDNGVSLHRLSSCAYQLTSASLDGTKTYVLIFYGLFPDTGYQSYEE